jgi:hypothetical protein
MISSVEIQGYRGFERFELSGLGRLNLLVGTNNSGKTSVLESIFLLMSAGDPASLWQVLSRRGERLVTEVAGSPVTLRTEAEVRHLFRGHEIQPGSGFALSGTNQTPSVAFALTKTSAKNMSEALLGADDDGPLPRLSLDVTGYPQPAVPRIPLTGTGGLSEAFESPRWSARRAGETPIFIASESLTIDELVGLWNSVFLTSAESLVLRALQFIDPEIERIAVQVATANSYYRSGSRGGFIVKRRGTERPIPIGGLGDGMWRMLVMAIAITQCRGGVLLVDEIDTGLHYSVMSDMWKLIFNAAKELDVQVFATTHSYDCVYSLAQICADADERNPITVQRIEPGKSKAIPYAQNEIRIAADREIEVR